ncbi:MAG: hypothetical protein KGD66_05870 [Candidatus Lokiarchaeota archaeon]|nr:hypothetical protein [Candidatus Lokiarchaeota archaeon]
MQLYSVAENGALRKIKKIDFNATKVYLIDDIKTFYIWIGNKASNKKVEYSNKRANDLNKKREKKQAKIVTEYQGKEFGAFLAIMELLKKGEFQETKEGRRPELKINYKDTLDLLEAGIEPDFEGEVTLACHDLIEEGHSYETLSKKLAKIQIQMLKGKGKITAKEINLKSSEILKSSSTYEELCWLITELSALLEKKNL